MFLRDFIFALVRRWYLVLAGTALALVVAYLSWGSAGAIYSARSIVMLLPPNMTTQSQTPGTPDGNPLLYLGSLSPARDALLVTMLGDEAQTAFQNEFPGSSFSVAPDVASSGPTIVVETESLTAADALASVRFAVEQVGASLNRVQDQLNVSEEAKVRSTTLTAASVARSNSQPQFRAAVVGGGSALVGTVLLVGLIDGLVQFRTRRRGGIGYKPGRAVEAEAEAKPDAIAEESPLEATPSIPKAEQVPADVAPHPTAALESETETQPEVRPEPGERPTKAILETSEA